MSIGAQSLLELAVESIGCAALLTATDLRLLGAPLSVGGPVQLASEPQLTIDVQSCLTLVVRGQPFILGPLVSDQAGESGVVAALPPRVRARSSAGAAWASSRRALSLTVGLSVPGPAEALGALSFTPTRRAASSWSCALVVSPSIRFTRMSSFAARRVSPCVKSVLACSMGTLQLAASECQSRLCLRGLRHLRARAVVVLLEGTRDLLGGCVCRSLATYLGQSLAALGAHRRSGDGVPGPAGESRSFPHLHRRIVARGAVVSEFPPASFRRDAGASSPVERIIAALASVLVVVEAGERSSGQGSPYRSPVTSATRSRSCQGGVTDLGGHGTFALLRDGAHPVSDARDVLELVNGRAVVPRADIVG